MAWDFSVFDLNNWKVTLPVDADYFDEEGDGNPYDDTAYERKGDSFEGFEAEEFFYYDEDEGAMIFRADVDGARTSSSTNYTRSELREMDGTSNAAWTIDEGGTLSATLKVTELAVEDDGDEARVIVGQIHGENDELTRLYYDSNGDLYYANEITGDDGEERLFYFEDENGNRPNVGLGEKFSYVIDVSGGKLNVLIYADDIVYAAAPTDGIDPTEIVDAWEDDTFYFKAGVYQGVTFINGHEHEGSGAAEAAFYAIDFGHEEGEGLGGWPPSAGPIGGPGNGPGDDPEPSDETPDGDSGDNTLVGTDTSETIKGRGGDDIIFGMDGDDTLWGNEGDDIIIGGAGADWLKGGNGADTYVLDDAGSIDTLADFSIPNGDRIDLSKLLDGQAGFKKDSAIDDGFIVLQQDGSNTDLYVNLNGSLVQIAMLENEDASGISLSDFILPEDTPDVGDGPTDPSDETPDGDSGDNTLTGTNDGETIKGRAGDDIIYGLDGDDELWGNEDNDTLVGGDGADWLKGGNGADTYVLDDAGDVDIIADFSISDGDRIDLIKLLDGQPGFNRDSAIDDGFIVLEQSGSDTNLSVKIDGSLVQVATLENEDASGISLSDFILPGNTPNATSEFDIYLADADSDEFLIQISDGAAIDSSLVEGRDLTIVVESALDGLESVRMSWDDHVQTESYEPYALFGDRAGNDYNGGATFDEGRHDLSLTAFDGNGGNGDILAAELISFTIV